MAGFNARTGLEELEEYAVEHVAADIIVNAHRINAGERIPIGKSSRDFLFIKRDDPNAIINAHAGT
jgi:hypothetical protein